NLARIIHYARNHQLGLGSSVGLVLPRRSRRASWHYAGGIGSAAAICFREKKRSSPLATLGSAHASRHASLLLLRLDALALPGVDTFVLSSQLQSRLEKVCTLLRGCVLCRRRG